MAHYKEILDEFTLLVENDDHWNLSRHGSGVYVFYLRKEALLPDCGLKIKFRRYKGRRIFYSGSSNRLYSRLIRGHLKHGGVSTIRRTIGALFGFVSQLRYPNSKSKTTRFSVEEEQVITDWIRNNIIIQVYFTKDYKALETWIIKEFLPPGNLSQVKDRRNLDLRKLISCNRKPAVVIRSIQPAKG